MKTISATITVPNRKAPDARAALEKNLHVLAQSLKLRNRNHDAYTVAEGDFLHVTGRETATILAALRYWQADLQEATDSADYDPDAGIIDNEHFREHKPLTPDEIDAVCERINCDGTSPLLIACYVALDSLQQLADKAGDVDEFNDGGHAREACRILRNAIGRI